jgi:hypothetical protein
MNTSIRVVLYIQYSQQMIAAISKLRDLTQTEHGGK